MTNNQDIPEFEEPGNPGPDIPIVEILNPEQLARENQALKDKVGAMETQMAEVLIALQALKETTAASADAATTIPPPRPAPGHPSPSQGVNGQNTSTVTWPAFGLPAGYTPPGAEANPRSGQVGVTGPIQFAATGPSGPTLGTPSPTPGVAANPLGTAAYYHPYGMGVYPQGHLFESSQSKDRFHLLEERLRAMEGSNARAKDAQELCLVQNVILPTKFKVPDFDKYRGTSCPQSHLTMYCRKMTAFAHDDKVLIHYFQDSLAGASLNWYMKLQPSNIHSWRDLAEAFLKQYKYNEDMAPDRSQLQSMGKRDNESFKEYAQRWRSLAAQVTPSLTEKEMVHMCMETLPAMYYDRLVGSVSSNFSDMVNIGERIENGARTGKITDSSVGSGSQKKSSFNYPKKKEESANAISGTNAVSTHPPQAMPLSVPMQSQPANTGYQGRNYQERRHVNFDPIPMTYAELFKHLIAKNLVSPRTIRPYQPPFPKGYDSNATCEFHAGLVGHTVENCKAFKFIVQELIDANWLSFKQNGPSVATNPLPKHEGPAINVIESRAEQVLVRDVRDIRTSLEAIHAELRRSGIIEEGCCRKEGCADSLCVGTCEAFKMILQDLMDRHVVQMGYVKQEEEVLTLHSDGRQNRAARAPVEILYDCNPMTAKAKPQPIILEVPAPFQYNKDSAVPWNYSAYVSAEMSPKTSSVTNIAGGSGMTRSGRMFAPEMLRGESSKEGEDRAQKGKAKETEVAERRKVTEQETSEFLKIMRQSDYKIVEQLNQTPAKISMLSLLLDSEAHRSTLLKILNDAHVNQDISVGQFDGIVGNIVSANYLTFNDDELPPEGKGHNQALHISVKCGDYMLSRVLIDNGSSLNVMPKTTMNKLDVDCSYMKPSSTLVRAFDGSKKEVLGEMEFPLQIGPETFYVNFQVMDITSSYSCLLGRPWIHVAGAVPSTLHQRVKFVGNNNVVVVFGEEEMLVNKPSSFRYVEAAEESLETAFQSLEIANAVFAGGNLPLPMPRLSKNAEMVAKVMLDQGYKLGYGLGKSNQGISTPIQLKEYRDRCGLGYHSGRADRRRIAEEKRERRQARLEGREPRLSRVSVCNINQSFRSAGLLNPNQIAAIEEGPSDEDGAADLVRRCLAEEEFKNWETADFPVVFSSK